MGRAIAVGDFGCEKLDVAVLRVVRGDIRGTDITEALGHGL